MKYIILGVIVTCIIIIYKYNESYEYESFTNIQEDYILPKRIYSYYDEPNDIILSHYDTWKKRFPDWEIILINNNNLYKLVNNAFIEKYVKLDSIKFSDFLRVYLLKENGGVWLDGGIFVIDNFLNKYHDEMMKNKYDVCLYEFTIKTVKHNNVLIPHLDNWFMMSKKNSKYMNDLFDEFTRAYDMGFLEYKKNVLRKNNINLINTLNKHENDIYLMQHAIAQYLVYKNGLSYYNINLKIAEESMFYLQQLHNWNSHELILDIINRSNWTNIYAVKLIGANRKAITDEIKNKYITKINSL